MEAERSRRKRRRRRRERGPKGDAKETTKRSNAKMASERYSARDSRQFRAKLPCPRAVLFSFLLRTVSSSLSLSLSVFQFSALCVLFTVISLSVCFSHRGDARTVGLCMKSPLTFVSRRRADAAAKRVLYQPATPLAATVHYSSNISNRLLLIHKLDGQLIKLHNVREDRRNTPRVFARVWLLL